MDAKTTPKTKGELRREMKRRLGKLPAGKIASYSESLLSQLTFPPKTKVALFAATKSEPFLLDLIMEDPQIEWFLPKVKGTSLMDFISVSDPRTLTKGSFGIFEPTSGWVARQLDVIVCPGLAFTLSGKRLGQGGGFYDRAFMKYPGTRKLGVCFPEQILPEIPTEEHDVAIDLVITPTSEP